MAGAALVVGQQSSRAADYKGGLTSYVVIVAIMIGCAGLLSGYDNGVISGVESMVEVQQKFFPAVYEHTEHPAPESDPYCNYDNQQMSAVTSTLYLTGMVSTLFASPVLRAYGRKPTLFFASVAFLIGSGLCAGAQDLAMLVVGRMFLGVGVGFANNAAPVYLSETAPHRYRGGLNIIFQLTVTMGILISQLINYGTQEVHNGWRISLGLAGVPALILMLGSLIVPESPRSLIERGHREQGRAVLQRLRGTAEVDMEFEDICSAAEEAQKVTLMQSWRALFSRTFAPMLFVTVVMQFFQQFTGINAIMFYAPAIFQSIGGSARRASLLNTVIIGSVNVGSTFVAIGLVDRLGRRTLLIEAGVQMFAGLVSCAGLLGANIGKYGNDLPAPVAKGTLAVICIYVASFAWSYGPMGWLIPSEIMSLETREAGMAAAVCANFLFTFVIAQGFLSMLCAMKWGVFLFFGGWVVIMTLFVIFLLPETRGVPLEDVPANFARHWLWSVIMGEGGRDILRAQEARNATHASGKMESASASEGGASFSVTKLEHEDSDKPSTGSVSDE